MGCTTGSQFSYHMNISRCTFSSKITPVETKGFLPLISFGAFLGGMKALEWSYFTLDTPVSVDLQSSGITKKDASLKKKKRCIENFSFYLDSRLCVEQGLPIPCRHS